MIGPAVFPFIPTATFVHNDRADERNRVMSAASQSSAVYLARRSGRLANPMVRRRIHNHGARAVIAFGLFLAGGIATALFLRRGDTMKQVRSRIKEMSERRRQMRRFGRLSALQNAI